MEDALEVIGFGFLLVLVCCLITFAVSGIVYETSHGRLHEADATCRFAGYNMAVYDVEGNEYCIYLESVVSLEAY